MSVDFPVVTVVEGEAEITIPDPSRYKGSKAPVFYNPRMEVSRDIDVLALEVYGKGLGRSVAICEPLTGCGVRGVRLVMEVEGVERAVLNDINPYASSLAELNVKRNKLQGKIEVFCEDANLLLSRYAAPSKRFDYVDVDPFGSPVTYLDSAMRALRGGGLLALTATDTAPLYGVHPKACLRKYGGKPLRTEYHRELGLRILAGHLVASAAKHDMKVTPVFSYSVDHYVRVYAILSHSAREADDSLGRLGYILHCFNCLHRETSQGLAPFKDPKCPECGSNLRYAGPLWLGQLSDKDFCEKILKELEKRRFSSKRRIGKLLRLVDAEREAPLTYYVTDFICDKYGWPIPPLRKVIDALKRGGFMACKTHFHTRGVKTNAQAREVIQIVRSALEE